MSLIARISPRIPKVGNNAWGHKWEQSAIVTLKDSTVEIPGLVNASSGGTKVYFENAGQLYRVKVPAGTKLVSGVIISAGRKVVVPAVAAVPAFTLDDQGSAVVPFANFHAARASLGGMVAP